MNEWWFWLLLIVAVPYIGAPILIRFTQRMAASPRFLPILPSDLPPEAAGYLSSTTNSLRSLGFVPEAFLSMPDQVPNVKTYLVLLVNRVQGDQAMVTQMYGLVDGVPRLATSYLEFSTRYENGQTVDTMNSDTLGSFKVGRNEIKTQAPAVKDAADLYRLHQYVQTTRAKGGAKTVYEPGQAEPYLCGVMVESYDQQVGFGWLYPDAAAGVYRPTWKGAFLMTWGLLWPVLAVRKALLRRKEAALLKTFRADRLAGRWSPA